MDLDLLRNIELKEAFDEFDKVVLFTTTTIQYKVNYNQVAN